MPTGEQVCLRVHRLCATPVGLEGGHGTAKERGTPGVLGIAALSESVPAGWKGLYGHQAGDAKGLGPPPL